MYEELREIIDNSHRIVFFGGAGVSTESGVPDFRSENGLWNAKTVSSAPRKRSSVILSL